MVSEPLVSKKKLKSVFCIEPNEIDLNDNANNVIIGLKNRVSSLIDKIKQKHNNIDLTQINSNLSELNIKPEDTYLYLNGHLMYDCMIKILMKKVIENYRKQKQDWFQSQEQTEILKTKQKEYNNHIKNIDWKTLMNDGHMYCLSSLNKCPSIQKIKQDINNTYHP